MLSSKGCLLLGVRFLKLKLTQKLTQFFFLFFFFCAWVFEVLVASKGGNLADISQNLELQRLPLLNKV